MDNTNEKIDELWKPCPAGKIQQVVDQTGSALRQPSSDSAGGIDRRALMKIAAAVAVVTGAGVLSYNLRSSAKPSVNNYNFVHGGIGCSEVLDKLAEYIDHSMKDQELTAKIDDHLKVCSKCRMKFEQLKEGLPS